MTSFSFTNHTSQVRDPYHRVELRPAEPFALNDESSPWGGWLCDRFVGYFDQGSFEEDSSSWDEVNAFIEHRDATTATALAQAFQGYFSFDGEIAFIPASHAEDFHTHLQQFLDQALGGQHDTPSDTLSNEVNIGTESDDMVGYWGSTTTDGLFLLFAMSCDSIGEDWLASAFKRYPRRAEITAPAGATTFGPRFAFFHSDCHLADHLYPGRHDDNPLYVSFLTWAGQKGYLRVREE